MSTEEVDVLDVRLENKMGKGSLENFSNWKNRGVDKEGGGNTRRSRLGVES